MRDAKTGKEERYRTTIKRERSQQNPNRNHDNGTLKKVKMRMKAGGASGRGGGGGGSHHEESRVHHSPGGRDDLAAASVERLLSDDCVKDLKLDIPDG